MASLHLYFLALYWATIVSSSTWNTTASGNSTSNTTSLNPPDHQGFEVVFEYVNADKQCSPRQCESDSGYQSNNNLPAISLDGNAKLLPCVDWNADTSSMKSLVPIPPGNSCQLWHGNDDRCVEGYYGMVTYFFTLPSVNLDQCDHITQLVCNPNGCEVKFNTQEAYQQASTYWKADELVFITFSEGCEAHENGDRCYLHSTSLEFHGGLSVAIKGEYRKPDDLTSGGEAEWGVWMPSLADTASGLCKSLNSHSNSTSSSKSNETVSVTFGEDEICKAPPDTKYGLPTACLGDLFDQDLDNNLGLTSLSPKSSNFINVLAPGLQNDNTPQDPLAEPDFGDALSPLIERNGEDTNRLTHRANLEKRGFGGDLGKAIGGAIGGDVGKELGNAAGKLIDDGVKEAGKFVNKVRNAANFGVSVGQSFSFKLPDTSKPQSTKPKSGKAVKSPWGPAILLQRISKKETTKDSKLSARIDVFCVGCGASGSVRVAGHAKWNAVDAVLGTIVGSKKFGVTALDLEARANAKFTLQLGIDAQIKYKKKVNNQLLAVGLPGLSFGVITIGPYVELGSTIVLDANGRGGLLAGAIMKLPNSIARIDFIDSSRSTRVGWKPSFTPILKAQGNISLSASLGLPVSINLGVKISDFYQKSIGLVDEPSIKATAQADYSYDENNLSLAVKSSACDGITTNISWRNRLYLRLSGSKDRNLLDTGDKTLSKKCIRFVADVAPTLSTRDNSSSIEENDDSVFDATDEVVADADVSYELPSLPSVSYTDENGYGYTNFALSDSAASFVSCADGNIYGVKGTGVDALVSSCESQWATYDGGIVASGADNIIYYYSNTLSKVGVSRLRVANFGSSSIPTGAVAVVFGAADSANGTSSTTAPHFAVDSEGKVLFLIACVYSDSSKQAKLFVATDPDAGVKMLESVDLVYSVTGGAVDECFAVPIVAEKIPEDSYTEYDSADLVDT